MAALLIPVLTWFSRYLVAKFALTVGVFTISTAIANSFFTYLQGLINSQLGALPANLSGVVALVGVPEAIAVIFAAYSTALTLKGLSKFAPSSGG